MPSKTYKVSIWQGTLNTRGGRNYLEDYIEVSTSPLEAINQSYNEWYDRYGAPASRGKEAPGGPGGQEWGDPKNLSGTVIDFAAKRVYKFKKLPFKLQGSKPKLSDIGWKKLGSFKVGTDISTSMLNKSRADVDLKDFTNPRGRGTKEFRRRR